MIQDGNTPEITLWIKKLPDGKIDVQLRPPIGASDLDEYEAMIFAPRIETIGLVMGKEQTHRHLANVIETINTGASCLLLLISESPQMAVIQERFEEGDEMPDLFDSLPQPDMVVIDSVVTFALNGSEDEIMQGIEHWATGKRGDQEG